MTTHILFDFFGTLVEYSPSRTEQGYPRAFDVLRSTGCRLDYETFLSLWSEVSAHFDESAERTNREFSMLELGLAFLERAGVIRPGDAVHDFVDAYLSEWNTGVRSIDGLPVMLEDLNRRFSMSIITNTHDPELVPNHLQRLGIARNFDQIITSVEFGVRKPAPEIFEYALRSLETTGVSCVYVGDNYEADYVGANAAGIRGLLIDPRHEAPIKAVDRLDSVTDLSRVMSIPPSE